MTIGKSLIPEFEMEMVGTRKVLERIPDDKLGWKIHDKSNTIGWVANHLSDIPGWVEMTLNHDNLDLDPPGGEPFKSPDATSTAAILELFDKNVAEGRKLLDSVPDETLFQPWALLKAGEKLLEMPKIAVLRTWVLNPRFTTGLICACTCESTTSRCRDSTDRRATKRRCNA